MNQELRISPQNPNLKAKILQKVRTQKGDSKKQGYVLVVTFVLSSLILGVGISLAQVLATELEFSADLLFAEKSYFAAESGIEKALIELKENPIQQIDDSFYLSDADESAEFNLNIGNGIKDISFTIPEKGNIQFQLKKDTDDTEGADEQPVTDLFIQPSNTNFRWKVQCEQQCSSCARGKKTRAIVNNWSAQGGGKDLKELKDENGKSVQVFWGELKTEEKKSCFLTLENMKDEDLKIEITSGEYFTPPKAQIKSIGKSGSRKKIMTFDYTQKKLANIFNFGLLNRTSED